ncbi:MAG: MATE family efflux transporter [Clostridia bacterium]|nr:MATE family efflux transporter [Clostridia bacterium]
MAKSFEMDMTRGSLLKKLIIYALPIVGINLVQLLFNAADVAILGIFASDNAVAAVGSTTAIVNLIIGFFVGLSLSANVLVARCMGAGDREKSNRLIGTSMVLSVIFGLFLTIIGVSCSKLFLTWMKCPSAIIDMATRYMQIYFVGMPIVMLYNFSASIMRAVGDTLRPFIFLVVGGVLNIGLNIFFILVLHKDVEGVAIATVASQGVAAILSIVVLAKGKGFAKIDKKYLKVYKREFLEILKIGVPTGIQKCMFSLSNVVLTSTLNGFGESVVTANTIAHQFDAIVHDVTDAFAMSTMAFVSQNLGAKNFKRIWRVIWESLILVTVVSLSVGGAVIIFSEQLCGIMTDTKEVIEYGVKRLTIMSGFYFLTGTMGVFANVLRALGKALYTMIGSFFCTVLFRIIWIYLVFPLAPTLNTYYAVYPISWGLCTAVYVVIAMPLLIKTQRKIEIEKVAEMKTQSIKTDGQIKEEVSA